MIYILHIAILVAIYSILAMSLDVLVGHSGLLSLTQGAFFGIGAYASAQATVIYHLPFIMSLMVGMIAAWFFSVVLALFTARLKGDFYFIATFAFQLLISYAFVDLTRITGGPLGIVDIRPYAFFWMSAVSQLDFAVMAGLCAVIVALVIRRITAGPLGRALHCIREDDVISSGYGKNVFLLRLRAMAVSAVSAAIAGVLYAHYVTFIDPSSFTFSESVLVLAMVVIGGSGSVWGPVVGASTLILLPELLRFVGLSSSTASMLRQIMYGSALIGLMLWRSQGLIGKYDFRGDDRV